MLFRLHRAAATFQRLVDTILGPREGYTFAYLEHVIFYSKTWEEHMAHQSQALHHLQESGLKINPKKSKLGFTELAYLGYTLWGRV